MILLNFKIKRHEHLVSRQPVQKNQCVLHSSAKETRPSRLAVNKTKTAAKKPTAHQVCLAM